MFDGSWGTGNVYRKIEKSPWENWFAWRPVTTVNKERVWGRTIFRRSITRYGGDNGVYSVWEYADIFDVIGE